MAHADAALRLAREQRGGAGGGREPERLEALCAPVLELSEAMGG